MRCDGNIDFPELYCYLWLVFLVLVVLVMLSVWVSFFSSGSPDFLLFRYLSSVSRVLF